MNPLVSVVIPLFNKEQYIERCLRSVRAQTMQDLEVIIVDDGSTDAGPEIAARLLTDRDRLIRQANAGPGPARNRAIAASRGAYIAFIDADDTWLPEHLADKLALLGRHPEAAMAAGPTRPSQPGEQPLAPPHDMLLTDYFQVAASARRQLFQTSSVIMRRSALERVGHFLPICPGEDSELWIRVALELPIALSQRITADYDQKVPGSVIRVVERRQASYPPTVATLEARLDSSAVPTALVDSVHGYCAEWLMDYGLRLLREGRRAEARGAAERAAEHSIAARCGAVRAASHLPGPLASAAARVLGSVRRRAARVQWPKANPQC